MGSDAFAASSLTNVKAFIYSKTAAELQWNRTDNNDVQVSYNGSEVASIDANSYFTGRLDPAVTHHFQLRTIRANGTLSEPVELTFNSDDFSLPVREIRVEDSPALAVNSDAERLDESEQSSDVEIRVDNFPSTDNSSLPSLGNVHMLVYSSTSVELFWTRLRSDFTTVEITHNNVALGDRGKAGNYFSGLDSSRIHEFRIRALRESSSQDDGFSISDDLRKFSGEVQEITATGVLEQSNVSITNLAPVESDQDRLAEEETAGTPVVSDLIVAPADDPVVPPVASAPILPNDCVVRSLAELRSCVDSAQGIERINIQSDLSCTDSSCCPTGAALLRLHAVSNLTIEGNGHTLLRRGGQRQCSLLDITQSQNVVLNNWMLDDDASVAPCLVTDECPRMLHIRNASNISLNEVDVRNGKGYVIYVQQVNGFNFLNSSLTNSGVLGLYVGHADRSSTNVRIQNSTFNDNQTNALALLGVSGSSVSDNIVSNNIFRRNHWRGQWAVAPRYGSGFTGGGQMYIAQASGLTVSGNLIEDGYCENCFVQQRFGSGVSGIELAMPGRNSVTNTLITNNVVNDHDAWGIFVNEGSSLDRSVVISNNILRNNTVGLKPASAAVSGNTISNR